MLLNRKLKNVKINNSSSVFLVEINIDGRQRTEDGGKCRVKTIFVFASNLTISKNQKP